MNESVRHSKLWNRRWVRVTCALVVVGMVGALAASYYSNRSEPEIAGGPPRARLIEAEQYVNAIRDVFGEDVRVQPNFAQPPRTQGLLSLGAADVVATPSLIEQFDRAAQIVAAQVMEERRRATLMPCTPRSASEADDACASKFFEHVGRFLFRRPLSEAELKLYVEAARDAAATYADFYAGIAHSLTAMMVSPKFLYLSEKLEPDPQSPGRTRLDAWSVATRLSLFLWNSIPDEALLTAAANGELHDKEGLERQVERLLDAPERVERGARAFFADLLLLDKFDGLTKDAVIYPSFTPLAADAAREQILRIVVDHLLVREADYRELFTTRHSFVNATLAPLYRLPADGASWIPVTLDGSRHAGLVTTVGFVAAHSHPGRSSPTLRGKAIREALLCQKVPDPPPNVDFVLFEGSLETLKTARERLSAHSTDPVCAGCHKITDPIGLALENFDGAGIFRATEKGAPIDVSGDLDGQAFTDAAGLGQAVRVHPALTACLVSRVYSHAVGRGTSPADRPWLAFMVQRFADDEYRYPDLLRRIALSRAFTAATPEG
jgi:Protein of unknown function (DUF1592)/Protein of unknown function (DUF1588)/Protein of unknown function (DUF1595)/Protein of unknown function (DUF1585)